MSDDAKIKAADIKLDAAGPGQPKIPVPKCPHCHEIFFPSTILYKYPAARPGGNAELYKIIFCDKCETVINMIFWAFERSAITGARSMPRIVKPS